MRRTARILCPILAGTWLLAAAAVDAPVLYCPPAGGPVALDGKLDDPAWSQAPRRDLARLGGLAPLHPVQFRALWDAAALYLAFESSDQDLRAACTRRDDRLWERDDVLEVFLSCPGSAGGLEVQLNPRNVLTDLYNRPGAGIGERLAWNWPGLTAAVQLAGSLDDDRRDQGWTAELRLPFAGLGGLGLAPPAAGAAPWRLQVCSMNRVQVAPGRLSRERSYWPVPSAEGLPGDAEYAPLVWLDRRPRDLAEGFARIVAGHCRRHDGLLLDYRGLAVPWEYDSTLPDAGLCWETAPLPDPLPDPVTLAFVGQIAQEGGAGGAARTPFVLSLGTQRLLRFEPFQTGDCSWQEGDCRLSFQLLPSPKPRSGLYRLQVPARLLTAGQPARLALRHTGPGPATLFCLKGYTDAALYAAQPPPPAPQP